MKFVKKLTLLKELIYKSHHELYYYIVEDKMEIYSNNNSIRSDEIRSKSSLPLNFNFSREKKQVSVIAIELSSKKIFRRIGKKNCSGK